MTVLKTILYLFLTAVISACSGDSDGSEPLSVEPVNWEAQAIEAGSWVVMGSSSAAGAGAVPGENSWAQVLQKELAPHLVSIVNLAKGGTVTYDGLSTIERALDNDPVLFLVSYPSNDTGVGYPSEETVRNILAIRSVALNRSVPVIVLSSQPRNDFSTDQLAQMTRIDRYLEREVGPCFVEVRSGLADASDRLALQYSYDGVHPNNAGHAVIAERIGAVLESGECVVLTEH